MRSMDYNQYEIYFELFKRHSFYECFSYETKDHEKRLYREGQVIDSYISRVSVQETATGAQV